jgi:Flp pilus assembly protein TadB
VHAFLNEPVYVAITITGGVILAWLAVLIRAHLRQRLVVRQFRGKLTLFANTFRDGRSFADAVVVLADLGPKPLCREFQKLSRQLQHGDEAGEIAREMCRRIPCFEAEYLATAVMCQQGSPEQLSVSLLRLEQLREKRELARERVASACGFARHGIRAALLLGPIVLTAVIGLRPTRVMNSLSQMVSSPAGWLFLGSVFVSAVWLVLILQIQDESEIVLD